MEESKKVNGTTVGKMEGKERIWAIALHAGPGMLCRTGTVAFPPIPLSVVHWTNFPNFMSFRFFQNAAAAKFRLVS